MKRKKLEQLEREKADQEAKARVDSDKRQKTIKRLWDLKELDLKAKTSTERKLREQKLKEQKLKTLQNCTKLLVSEEELERIVRELIEHAELKDHGLLPWLEICTLVGEIADLARLQDLEIEYLMQFRRELERIRKFYPQELENLSDASLTAELRPFFEKQFGETGKKDAKKKWERTKRRSHVGWVHSIEYQFGGSGEAEWRKSSFSGRSSPPYEPTCLGKILNGTPINMRELQDLFWPLRRDRFPKDLPSHPQGREVFYDHPAVPMIMEALLSERPAKPKRAQGKARRLWLADPRDPDLRTRVLRGIEAHMKSFASDLWKAGPDRAQEWQDWQTKIADPILKVLDPYLSNSVD